MKSIHYFLTAIISVLAASYSTAQCYSDFCIDAPSQTTPVPGCCIGTTVGMTTSYSGTINGCPLTNGQDAWMTFMAPSNGYLQIDFTAITIAGDVTIVVFDSFSNADNCATLNAGGVAAATECFNAATPPNPINLNYVQAGERYFILVSSPPGSTPGSWEICLSITVPTGGTDCTGATVLCDKNAINLASITAGGGSISGDESMEDVSMTSNQFGQNNSGLAGSCFGDGPGDGGGEVNSQWYLFTCGQSGTLQMALYPLNTYFASCNTGLVGDDYDWILLDVTTTLANNPAFYTCNINGSDFGGADSATVVACNWYGSGTGTGWQNGLTGFGAGNSFTTVFGYTGTADGCSATDDFYGSVPGNGNSWLQSDVNIVCGRTYALLISNYTGASTSGFNLAWGGTGLFGVQPPAISPPVAGLCTASTTITAPLCGGALIPTYTYEINWGDGTTTTATSTNVTHTYGSTGTYTITMVVKDPVGCQDGASETVSVICNLPVELTDFNGNEFGSVNKLYWKTATENNSDYFIVEKSEDNGTWTFLEKVDAAGYSLTAKYYTIDDPRPAKSTYYRLKQFDFNGSSETFAPINIQRDKTEEFIFSPASPNPSTGAFSIAYTGNDKETPVMVTIVSNDGRTCYQEVFDVQKSNVITISDIDLLPGNYILKLTQDDHIEIQRITVK